MRPIDDLREKIDLWRKSTTDTALMSVLHDVLKQIDMAIYEMDHQEDESPWHRVEEELPPKATWVLTVATDGNVKIFNIATVDAGGQWWTYSPQKILRELYGVRYWMSIEPPQDETNEVQEWATYHR